jgi:hypothetical protein
VTARAPADPAAADPAAAEARVRAAVDAGRPPDPADVRAVLDELDRARAESADRWHAIGRLAPRAKQHRGRAEDLERALRAVRAALAHPVDDGGAAVRALIDAALA